MSTYTGTPTRYNRETPIDLIGDLLTLHRLPGESLFSLKERIIDSGIHPANSTYPGLINGINRRLDMQERTGLIVDVVRDSDDIPLSNTLGLEITSKYMTLYSDHINGTILQQFNLHDRNGPYFVGDLLSAINALPQFEAISWSVDNYDKSMYLEKTDSKKLALQENLDGGSAVHTCQALQDYNYLVGNLVFPPTMNVTTEVSVKPANVTEFMVNYNRGVFWLYRPTQGVVSYWYEQFPLFIRSSPISIQRFKDDEYLELVTEQYLNEDGALQDDVPTYDGADYLNELFAVCPMFYGD